MKNGLREIIESGKFPGFAINAGNGSVDIARPLHWGKDVTPGGFAKQYTADGEPVYSSNRDMEEALAKARHHGENIRAVNTRDLPSK